MKTAEQRKTEFLQELRQLCFKYRCELSLSDDGNSPVMVLSFEDYYDDNGNFVEFELDNIYIPSSEPVRP